ncbi:MAG: hydroxymethylglutaryl-CoA lyase [Proteobacteria bacterium]|nr:hydroxymethylglutaryl-CoA lyase [Pseudomonadota bacterium]
MPFGPLSQRQVLIREVAPRDGLQIETRWIPTERKIELIDRLSATGVYGIQYTSFVPPKWVPQFQDADKVAAGIARDPAVKYIALVPNRRGFERALAAGVDEVTLPSAATETFAERNLNRSIAGCIETVREVVRAAPPGVVVSASVSMCFGCPYEGLVPVDRVVEICARIADAGAPVVTLGDTTGMGNPSLVRDVFRRVRARCPGTRLAAHFHNTRGSGLANALAALEEGVDIFDGSVGGLGGCPYAPGATGNIATEDLVNMFHGMGVGTGVDLEALVGCARLAEDIVGAPLPGQVMRAGPWPPAARPPRPAAIGV